MGTTTEWHARAKLLRQYDMVCHLVVHVTNVVKVFCTKPLHRPQAMVLHPPTHPPPVLQAVCRQPQMQHHAHSTCTVLQQSDMRVQYCCDSGNWLLNMLCMA